MGDGNAKLRTAKLRAEKLKRVGCWMDIGRWALDRELEFEREKRRQ